MATFVTHKIMGTALQTTERYTDLQARGVGAFGVIWYILSCILSSYCKTTNSQYQLGP